jgi:hypothetical protein
MAYNLTSAAASAGMNNRVFPSLQSAATDSPPAQQDALADALIAELKAVIDDLRSDHWRAGATAVP